MIKIALFVEDLGHRMFFEALIRRLAREEGCGVSVTVRNAAGGRGVLYPALADYSRKVADGRLSFPDIVVVVTDANCQGYAYRKREVEKKAISLDSMHPGILLIAVPDPHIERWVLMDSQAFKKVTGRPCKAPDQKCDKDRYKDLLIQAMRDAGLEPLFWGIEYAPSFVSVMDLERVGRLDRSFGQMVKELRRRFRVHQAG